MARATRRRGRRSRMMAGAFKRGQVVTYQGAARRGLKSGDQVTVRRISGGGQRYRIQHGNRMVSVAARFLTAGVMPSAPTNASGSDVRVDPIRVAKEVVASAMVSVPVTQSIEAKLADSPPAILAMLNALLELPAAGEALGGENRRRAWKRMVETQVMHGQYARQLR